MAIVYLKYSRTYNTKRSIITNKYLFGVKFIKSRKDGFILIHMIRFSKINKPLIKRSRSCIEGETESIKCKLEEEDSIVMLFLFIATSKASMFLKHLDST
jgi:hypothetical protein